MSTTFNSINDISKKQMTHDISIRNIVPSDYSSIITVVNDWWGGRNMADMLPKLFFIHFNNTSFVAIKDNVILGFLIGFISQTFEREAYIHFSGVNPEFRSCGIGKLLYNKFFETVQQSGCAIVRCVTSPVNDGSINFHKKMGFALETPAGGTTQPSVVEDYDGIGEHRVLFYKNI